METNEISRETTDYHLNLKNYWKHGRRRFTETPIASRHQTP